MGDAATAVQPAMSTEAVLRNHLQAARIGVDAVMRDYTDRSVLRNGKILVQTFAVVQ